MPNNYATPREALDELDRLAAICGRRLGAVRTSRENAVALSDRFQTALRRHRGTREDARRRFALPPGPDPRSQAGDADGDLAGLRQSLDDLMVAYAETLPAFRDARTVSRLAVDMVEVSKLRTVIDLWVEGEAA
jgi:hypothetical protein